MSVRSVGAPLARGRRTLRILLAALVLALAPISAAGAGEWSGYVAFESRGFFSSPAAAGQADHDLALSASFQPEYFRDWSDGDESFTFTGFLRCDAEDAERTHADVRELYWQRVGRRFELSAGVRKIFWGVTESQHLVDVINQTDLVEDLDGEEKLGQPMVQLALVRPWGTLDLFLLPGFRERTFPGTGGRIRLSPRVDADAARYQSGAGRGHVDWAVRWSRSVGDWDLGVAHFAGTGREPRLIPGLDDSGEPVLEPFHEQIDQTSLDLQATRGAWLWKLEAISRKSRAERFVAATGGFEVTFGNVGGSGVDVGVLAEYLWDERGERASTPYDDDVFIGARLAFNDAQSTDLLLAGIVDPDTGASFLDLQGSRRLGSSWKLIVKGRAFVGVPESDLLYTVRRDDYLQLEIARYF